MAAQKGSGRGKSTGNVGWGGDLYSAMGNRSNDSTKQKHDNVPWSLLITLLAVLLTFFIVMPVLGFMYMDMYHATNAAVQEVRKMKELRYQILIDRSKE